MVRLVRVKVREWGHGVWVGAAAVLVKLGGGRGREGGRVGTEAVRLRAREGAIVTEARAACGGGRERMFCVAVQFGPFNGFVCGGRVRISVRGVAIGTYCRQSR